MRFPEITIGEEGGRYPVVRSGARYGGGVYIATRWFRVAFGGPYRFTFALLPAFRWLWSRELRRVYRELLNRDVRFCLVSETLLAAPWSDESVIVDVARGEWPLCELIVRRPR
jgi:hypothetical protein